MRNEYDFESKYIVSKDRYRIYYEKHSPKTVKGLPLLLIHGLGCNITVWKGYIPIFLGKGHPIVALDLRGHGKSDKKADISFEKAAQDIDKILKKEKIDDVILIANCFGVGVGLHCYNLHPEKIRKMVFVTPTYINPLRYNKIANKFTKVFHNMLKKGLRYTKYKDKDYSYSDHTRDKKSKCLTLYLKNFKDNPIRTHLACFYQLITQDDSGILQKIDVPTLIIAAEKDHYTPLQISKDLKKMIPDSKLRIIKGMDHSMMIRIPNRINNVIHGFIK